MEGCQSPGEQSNHGDRDQKEKINIFLQVIKPVCVSVKKSDTVGNVKAILTEKEGISKSSQNLFFCGECLYNNTKLFDCGIQENSMVEVFVRAKAPLRLFVKPPSSHNPIVIEANSYDTIGDVKQSIMAGRTISCGFSLIFAGKQLAEERTLESLDIREGSTLHMVATPKDEMTLSVKMPRGEILKIEAKLLYSVWELKIMVESVAGYPVKDLTFIYNGEGLRDLTTLSSYDITEESVLEMVEAKRVHVRTPWGRRWKCEVYPEDLAINLMERIVKEQYLLNQLLLMFEGVPLSNHQTLASCNFKNNSTFDIVFENEAGIR